MGSKLEKTIALITISLGVVVIICLTFWELTKN
jgi:hypothetical protein